VPEWVIALAVPASMVTDGTTGMLATSHNDIAGKSVPALLRWVVLNGVGNVTRRDSPWQGTAPQARHRRQ
jgi:hypothetical protein